MNRLVFLLLNCFIGIVPAYAITYYYDGSGNLNLTSNWWTNTNGTGSNPANFTTNTQIFEIRNTTSVTISYNWTVSGTGSRVDIGNATVAAITLAHTSGDFNGTLNINAASSGTNTYNGQTTDANTPTLGTLSSGSTVIYNRNGTQTVQSNTYANLQISNNGGVKTSASTVTVNGILTIDASCTFNMSTFLLSGNPTSTSGTGTLQTANTADPAIPSGETWSFIVEYNGAAQTIEAGTYTAGVTASGAGNKTADAFTINGIFTINAGRIVSMGTNLISGNPTSTSGTGTLQTANTANPAIPTGETWSFIVEYNGAAQTIEAGTYTAGITASGSGDKTADAFTTNGIFTINAGRIVSMGTNLLSGNPTSTSGTGNLQTANTGNPAIPTGETWSFIVEYNGAAQTIEAGTYTAGIIVSGSGDKTADAITVNGILTINAGRILNMGTNALAGNPTTISGTGTLQTANTTATPIPSGESWSGLVSFTSVAGQTIVAGTFVDLTGTGGNRTLINGGTINISGVFTTGSGTYTVTNNTMNFNGAAQNIPALTYNNLTISGTGDKTATGTINVNAVLNINSGRILNMGTNLLGGNPTSTSGTGTLQTANTANPAIPTAETWSFIVEYNGAAQTIEAGTYTAGVTASGSGDKTADAFTINGVFTINAGRIVSMGTNLLSGNPTSTSGTGTLQTANTANPAIPTAETWSFIVEYNGAAQTIEAGTYTAGVTASGSGDKTADPFTINGVFTINTGRIVNMGTNLLSGNPTSTSGTGTLQTANTANPAIPTAEAWTFTVEYNGAAQTVEAGIYTNLTCSGTGNKTGEAIAVNGVLTINTGRILDMGTNVLSGTPTSSSGAGTLTTANTSATPIPSGVVWTFTVTYSSASAQTIVAGTYPVLTASGGPRTFSSSGVIIIGGTFTPGTGNYTIGTSTVRYITATGTIPVPNVASGGNYYNLDVSSGTWTLGATVITGNDFSVSGGSLTINNNTSRVVTINGNMVLTAGSVDCNPGTSGTTIINLKGNFSNTGCVFQNSGTADNGTVRFNGTGTIGAPQIYSNTTATNIIWINFSAESGTVLQLNTNMSLERETNRFAGKLYIQNGGTVNIQGFNVVASDQDASGGLDSVYIFAGGTLITQNATGVSGSFNDINTFLSVNNGANFEFRGANTGTFVTTPTANTINNLTVNNGSSLTLGQALTINGALNFTSGNVILGTNLLTLNGTISGTSDFVGSTTSTLNITGTGALGANINMNSTSNTTRSLNTLTINRTSSTITLGNSLRLVGTLTMSNGTLASAGNLRLISDATSTARIATITGTGAVTGNVIVERFIPSTARRWRFMSSCISNATLEDWRGEIYLTGAGTGTTIGTLNSNGFDATANNSPSVYFYNEPTTGVTDLGWTAQTNNTASLTNVPLVVGRGYRVFIRGDRSDLNRLNDTEPSQNAVTLNLVGTINAGNISMPVSYTNNVSSTHDGWNFVGNPYPSAYDWNTFWDDGNTGSDDGTNYTNIDQTIYIYDATANSYKSYNASTNSGTFNGIIAQGQAFFVKSTGSGTVLTLTENHKSSGTPTQLFKTSNSSLNECHIKLIADSINSDELIIKFMPDASVAYDKFDINKLANPKANISSKLIGNIYVTLDARPTIINNDTINIVVGTQAGHYKFAFTQLPQLANKYFYLLDEFLNTTIAVQQGIEIDYTITNQAASFASNRFKLIISNSTSLPVSYVRLSGKITNNKAELSWNTFNEINVSHFNLMYSFDNVSFFRGDRYTAKGKPNLNVLYNTTDSIFASIKYYYIEVVDYDGKTQQSNKIALSTASNSTPNNLLLCAPNPASHTTRIKHEIIAQDDTIQITIMDYLGRIYKINPVEKSNDTLAIDVSTIQNGVYSIILESSLGTTYSSMLVIMH
jgi:hypothetical protein